MKGFNEKNIAVSALLVSGLAFAQSPSLTIWPTSTPAPPHHMTDAKDCPLANKYEEEIGGDRLTDRRVRYAEA